MKTYKWMLFKIEHYTWINWSVYYGTCFFNVSFPKEMWFTGSILAVLTGIIIYANRTYLNQPEGIKQRCLASKPY
jgi:hypothetical protein